MRVRVPGAELFYTTTGRGPACLVPTAIGTEVYERQLAPALRDHLTLVLVDLRGGGQSTGDPTSLTFEMIAEDLEAVRRRLGLDRVAVLGHSVIGILAIEYGRRVPDHVSHVIAVGTPPHGDMTRLQQQAAEFFRSSASSERQQLLRDNLARLSPEAAFSATFSAQTPMRFADPRTDAAPLFAGASFRPALMSHLLGPLISAWDVTANVMSLTVPTFLGLGRHDYVVPHVLWEGVAERLPRATLALFEHSGHQPFVEEPVRFGRSVRDWMTRT
jgi:proline iminopeptidase